MSVEMVEKAMEFAKSKMEGYGSPSHDFWHVWRVWKLAERIGRAEMEKGREVDMDVVALSSLLHDVIDPKLADPEKVRNDVVEFLKEIGLSESRIEHVMGIIENMSFRKMMQGMEWPSLEFDIVSDADKLDVLGAIGVARTFAYTGEVGRPLYIPGEEKQPRKFDAKEYGKSGSAIGHFYEKLLILKDMMRTEEGKRIAEERHKFLEVFLEEFLKEWKGER